MSDYWTENGIEKPQSVIVCAANRNGTIILAGARHWDKIMRTQHQQMFGDCTQRCSEWEQGFIDQFGDFYTREEALEIVKQSGQRFNEERNGSTTQLFSEGLY